MPGAVEIGLMLAAAVLLIGALTPRLRRYRGLLWGSCVLLLSAALFPRPGNALGQHLIGGASGADRFPIELFGVAWWILGAWLVNRLLDLVLRHTWFPDDNEPHARRLFADLASVLVYVVALVGIMDTVLRSCWAWPSRTLWRTSSPALRSTSSVRSGPATG